MALEAQVQPFPAMKAIVITQLLLAFILDMPNGAMARVLRGKDVLTLHSESHNRSFQDNAPLSGAVPKSYNRFYRQKLGNYMNLQYFGNISIGGQTVSAIFDTGSFDVIVSSTRCKQCKKPPYNPEVSKTFRSSDPVKAVRHEFGSGPVHSELGYEDIKVGPLSSYGQAFHQIVKHDIDVLDSASFDAIVGMAPEGHNVTDKDKTLIDNLDIKEYSLCLESADGAPGWLTWGGELTKEQKESSAVVLPVIGKHHWALSLQSLLPEMHLSGAQATHANTLLCGRGCAAILDSGTSLISAPVHALTALKILLPPLKPDCSNFGDLPNLELVLGGHTVRLPPEAYVVRLRGSPQEKNVAGSFLHFKAESSTTGGDECIYGFMEVNRHTDFGPLWILGMPFFRLFHTTFSNAPKPEDRRIYLMGADSDCKPQTPSSQVEEVPGLGEAKPEYKGKLGVFPKMTVFNAVNPEQRRARLQRGPVTLEARDLRPPNPELFQNL